jgi:hypothetical protein
VDSTDPGDVPPQDWVAGGAPPPQDWVSGPPQRPSDGYPWPAAPQPTLGGLSVRTIVLLAIAFGLVVLSAIAITVGTAFVHRRERERVAAATTVSFPATVENLPRNTQPAAQERIRTALKRLGTDSGDAQAALYTDGGQHTLVVLTVRPKDGFRAEERRDMIAGFQDGARKQMPAGVIVSTGADRDPGRLGGRIGCVTASGAVTAQFCMAADAVVAVSVFDFSPTLDPDLPRRVREVVVHRR